MKSLIRTVLFISMVLLFSASSACSVFDGTDTPVEASSAGTTDTAGQDGTAVNDIYGNETGTPVSSSENTAVFQQVTVTEADKEANIDKFIGNWVDQSDSTRYAIISKTDIGYSYSDNESTFPAEVKDGVLQIHIEVDDAVATGQYDDATGILTIKYQDTETKLKKNKQGG